MLCATVPKRNYYFLLKRLSVSCASNLGVCKICSNDIGRKSYLFLC